MKIFNKKIWLITLSIVFLAVVAGFIVVFIQLKINDVKAGASDNLSGFAWSDNFGWISMNCSDVSCAYDYGVNIDPATGNLSGYAWSDNAGWIYFGPSNTAEAQIENAPATTSNPKQWARYDSGTGKISGWANILSLGNNGWISLADDNTGDTFNYGVTIDVNGDFHGWAWNTNSDSSGFGWISFNGSDPNAGGDYRVVYDMPIPDVPINLRTTVVNCNAMRLDWDDVSNEDSYEGQYDDGVSGYQPLTDCNTAQNINYCSFTMPASATWKFQVRARNSFGVSAWSSETVGTTPFCAPSGLTITQKNCQGVTLSWDLVDGAHHYNVERAEDGGAPTAIANNLNLNTYIDTDIASGYKYSYYVLACNEEESYCQTAGPSEEITPCPDLPSWQEVNP